MNAVLLLGLLIFGGCLFTAGWVTRQLLDQPLRRRRLRLARGRWNRERRRGGIVHVGSRTYW
jgi:hypothetical protein